MDLADLKDPKKAEVLQRKAERRLYGRVLTLAERELELTKLELKRERQWAEFWRKLAGKSLFGWKRGGETTRKIDARVADKWVRYAEAAKQREPDRSWSSIADEIRRTAARVCKLDTVNDLPPGWSLRSLGRRCRSAAKR